MKESAILQMRNTLFMTCFINYTEESKALYSDLLHDAHTEALLPPGLSSPTSLAPAEYGPWKLTNGNLSINFGQGRVDIEKKTVAELNNIEGFLSTSITIFKKIVAKEAQRGTNLSIFRYAFAPVIAYDFNDGETKDSIASKLFVNNKFKGAGFDNADLSAVFKVQEKFDGKVLVMNYNYHLGFGEKRQNNNGETPVISDCAIIELDINTATDDKMIFNESSIEEFFSTAISRKNEFVQFIIKGI